MTRRIFHIHITTHLKRALLIGLILWGPGALAQGHKGSNPQAKIDPEVYAYFVKCNSRMREPVVLSMADTLFQMAKAVKDSTVQCAALLFKGEYWLHHEDMDSVSRYCAEVQRLARKLNRPKYYYQAWGRKIQLMMYQYYFQGALEELQQLEAEAERDGDLFGMMTSCRLLETYYSLRHNWLAAAHYAQLLVERVTRDNLDPYNLHYYYIDYARDLDLCGQPDRALAVLDQALRLPNSRPDQQGQIHCLRTQVHVAQGDLDAARRDLNKVDSLIPNAFTMADNVKAHADYLTAVGRAEEGYAWIERYERLTGIHDDFEKEKIETLFRIPGRETEGAALARRYFAHKDSLLVATQSVSFEEFATRMKVSALEEKHDEMRLYYSRSFLWCTLVLLVILLGSTLYFLIMYRKLKHSRADLSDMTRHKVEMEDDIHVARGIQMQMLNGSFPEGRRFDLHAHLQPAKRVSGDLYDYILDGDRLYFIVGDVSGKGVSASLYMTVATCTFRSFAKHCDEAAEIARVLNKVVCENSVDSMFVTAICGILHLDTGQLSLCSAGHHPPIALHKGADGRFATSDLFMEIDLPCGLEEHYDYTTTDYQLAPGDALFVYTDGLPEAMNHAMEQYESDRLLSLLTGLGGHSAEKIVRSCIADVEHFVSGAPQADDITMLVITYLGNGNKQ